ncbi:MAG: hypothetical protein KGS48_00920 [Bacteroidetes bacterium]|nr:hypothetical protein [Bacteroidota bacterium]
MEILDDVYTQSDFGEQKNLPADMLQHWKVAGQWNLFNAIVGFLVVGFCGLFILSFGTLMGFAGMMTDSGSPIMSFITRILGFGLFSAVLFVATGGLMFFFLIQFAIYIQRGIKNQDQALIELAWKSMLHFIRLLALVLGISLFAFLSFTGIFFALNF